MKSWDGDHDDYDPGDDYEPEPEEWPEDRAELPATDLLREFFENNREKVFYLRQLCVLFQDRFFHRVTGRAVRNLVDGGQVKTETRPLPPEERFISIGIEPSGTTKGAQTSFFPLCTSTRLRPLVSCSTTPERRWSVWDSRALAFSWPAEIREHTEDGNTTREPTALCG